MILGDPAAFAIEVYDEGESPQWLGYGRMCLHLAGRTLGNIDDSHCSLWHPIERIEEVARGLPSLWKRTLEGRSDEELFDYLDELLYTGEVTASADSYRPHDFLTNTGEMFDGEKSFVLRDRFGAVRIIWQGRDEQIRSAHIPRAQFCAVTGALSQWFESVRMRRRSGV